jgi:hypothetical protein
MSVSVKVTADVSGFEGGMAKASNAVNQLFNSEQKLQRSIKGLAMDLTNVSSPADLVTRSFFRMESAMALGTGATVAMAAAMYVFNDFKKYAANIDAVTKALEGMEKARGQAGMSQGDKEIAAAREQQGKLGNFGPGAVVMEGLSNLGFGDSPVAKEIELFKRLQQEIKNAKGEEENRQRALADTVKQEIAALTIAEKDGPIAAMRFGYVIKINEARYAGNNLLADELTKLMDIKAEQMKILEEKKKGLELDKNMQAEVERFAARQKETASLEKSNNDRIFARERARLPIMDQIEAKTQDIEAMRAKMADMSGPEAEKMREAIIGSEDQLQGLLDKAGASSSVTTSKGSLITDSLARVGGGGGVFQSGPQQSFTKISSNTDTLVTLVKGINERIGAGTVTYQ